MSESVLKRYVSAIALLQAYWRAHDIDAPLDDSFDFCMGDYIEHLYAEGEPKGYGTDVLALCPLPSGTDYNTSGQMRSTASGLPPADAVG